MKDAQCDESNEKSNFLFYFLSNSLFSFSSGFTLITMKFFIKRFFKSVQIYMKDADLAESKEKSNFRFFHILFFELWLFFGHFVTKLGDVIKMTKKLT